MTTECRARGRFRHTPPGWGRALLLALWLLILTGTSVSTAPQSSIAVAPTPNAAGGVSSKFGVVTHSATRYAIPGKPTEALAVVAESGTGWIREEFRWDIIEHDGKGLTDWVLIDEMVNAARGKGLEILGLLCFDNPNGVFGVAPHTVPDMARWKAYVNAVVSRYKDRVHSWEVWNEPDGSGFWPGSVADYVNLLKESYATIKAADPAAKVMNGAPSNLDMIWFNDFLNQGGAAYTDALAFHPYVARSSLDNGLFTSIDLPHFKEIQARTGKAWWFTEIGWSSAPSGTDYGGGVGSEQAQASYMVRQYVEALGFPGLNVEHVFWYDFRDDTASTAAENAFGLVRSDWKTPKPSYGAYQQLTKQLAKSGPLMMANTPGASA